MAHQRRSYRRNRRHARGHQERCSQRHRGAEPGGTLEEQGKEPRHHQRTQPRIRVKPGQACPQPLSGPRPLLEVVDAQCRPDDTCHREGDERSLCHHACRSGDHGELIRRAAEAER